MLLFALVQLAVGLYVVEYTHQVITPGVMTLAYCRTPGCNDVYHTETGYSTHGSYKEALQWVNDGGVNTSMYHYGQSAPKAFSFVALYNTTLIPTKHVKTGERTEQVTVDRVVDRMEWVIDS